MGIAFKDLKVGSFYKGYHAPAPAGAKCFFLVLQVGSIHSANQPMPVEVRFVMRKTGSKQWSSQVVHQGLPDAESLLKQEVRPADVTAEGIALPPRPQAPVHPAAVPVAPSPVPRSSPGLPTAPSKPTPAELAAIAKAKRNAGKVAIPENAHSEKCVKCGGGNKLIAMFSFSAYYCPACEPE